jgi:hypothetical protein
MNPAGPGGTAAGIDRAGNNQGLCQVAAGEREFLPINGFAGDFRRACTAANPGG